MRRPRGEWKRWKAEHWPILTALEAGDAEPYQRFLFARIEAVSESAASYCIYCRALMAVAESGEQFCPYNLDRNHDRAKAILGPHTVDMLE